MKICPKHQSQSPDRLQIDGLVERLCASYADGIGVNHSEGLNLPREAEILDLLNDLIELIFPGFAEREAESADTIRFSVGDLLIRSHHALTDLLCRVFRYTCTTASENCDCKSKAAIVAGEILGELPDIRDLMKDDVQAAYAGDPAARNKQEVISLGTLAHIEVRQALFSFRQIHRFLCKDGLDQTGNQPSVRFSRTKEGEETEPVPRYLVDLTEGFQEVQTG